MYSVEVYYPEEKEWKAWDTNIERKENAETLEKFLNCSNTWGRLKTRIVEA